MSLADYTLLFIIILFLFYCVYDEIVIDKLKGKTLLKVFLKKSNRIDGFIFIALLAIIFYNNSINQGAMLTHYLLIALVIIALYTFFIRRPKLLLKSDGLFFANVFIPYERIRNITLSEKGTLFMTLESRSIAINVTNINDLEKIYSIMRQH